MSTTVRRTLFAGALAAALAVLVTVVALGSPAGAAGQGQGRLALIHDVLHGHGIGLRHK
ncbi:hypothetical protein ACFXOD_28385 [Streptomyces sp. NPDC059161]|uniref:hypothetical protein n=1 Tax=Streptomyces sp. NPDC059161 TaxID=3346749 RepID=UPI0036A5D7FE